MSGNESVSPLFPFHDTSVEGSECNFRLTISLADRSAVRYRSKMFTKSFSRGVLIGAVWFINTIASLPNGYSAPENVTTWHNDPARSGVNSNETVLTPSNVNPVDFGKLFEISVDGQVFAQPLYLTGLEIPGKGMHNVVFIATEHDSVYACDADDGTILWHVMALKSGETASDNFGCDIMAEVGITATPVISNNVLFVQAMSKDANGNYFQRLHAFDIFTGEEMFGGPVDINATYPKSGGTTVFNPSKQFDRAGLVLANGVIYTTWSSFCDALPYNGWVIGYDTTLRQAAVINLTANGSGGSIWAGGAAPAVDSAGNLFFMTANGTFDTSLDANGFPASQDFGGCFVKLGIGADNSLTVADYFAPFNTVEESALDLDLGSGGVLLLPDMIDEGGQTRHLAVGAGKDAHIYIADRDNMGKFNSESNSNVYQDVAGALIGQSFGSPAFFDGHLYYASFPDHLKSFQFIDGRLDQAPIGMTPTRFGFPGASPAISANGTDNGIVWAAEYATPAVLHAYSANDVSNELYNSSQAPDGRDNFGSGNKFVVPIIANGKVYVGTQTSVGVFGLFDPPRLANVSARAQVGSGDDVLVAGFIVQGSATRNLVIRGIGPSLGVDRTPLVQTLQDPVLELHDSSGAILEANDNWNDGAHSDVISALGLAPTDPRESAMYVGLTSDSYTVVMRGVGDSTGLGLVELYDVSQLPNSTVVNLSARSFVGAGDDVLIGGMIVTGIAPQMVIMRAIGPDLASSDVSGVLADPLLELYDGNGVLLASNDNWRSGQEAEIIANNLAPTNDLDPAIFTSLAPGNYTAIVRGTGGATGVALLESYALH